MTKKNNSKTSVGNVVFLGAKPDLPDIEPVVGEIVAKHKKVWQGVDYRFARDDEPLPASKADPNELIGYCDVRTLGERRASGSSRDHPGGAVDYPDVPPNVALPFKVWLARVWRVHGQSAGVRRLVVAGCEAQARKDLQRPEAVWADAWQSDREYEGPVPPYPVRLQVVPVPPPVDQRQTGGRGGVTGGVSKRKRQLAYRVEVVHE